ncbi:uncharacterized protein PG986_011658 [Apiospora aurea]|uniref:Uncharacterized protein n=1 Tax=Apiospora aurea TaxID=335848 RepID=A0ABR1PY25_9PEZI
MSPPSLDLTTDPALARRQAILDQASEHFTGTGCHTVALPSKLAGLISQAEHRFVEWILDPQDPKHDAAYWSEDYVARRVDAPMWDIMVESPNLGSEELGHQFAQRFPQPIKYQHPWGSWDSWVPKAVGHYKRAKEMEAAIQSELQGAREAMLDMDAQLRQAQAARSAALDPLREIVLEKDELDNKLSAVREKLKATAKTDSPTPSPEDEVRPQGDNTAAADTINWLRMELELANKQLHDQVQENGPLMSVHETYKGAAKADLEEAKNQWALPSRRRSPHLDLTVDETVPDRTQPTTLTN